MLQSQIDPALLQQFGAYFDPSAFSGSGGNNGGGSSGNGLSLSSFQPSFTNPNPAYSVTSNLLGSGVASQLDPIGSLLSGLFGGGSSKPVWKPYVDSNGNYVWDNPKKRNPVPVTQVPGAGLKPNSAYKIMANNISALSALFPQFSSIIAGQAIPQAQAQLAGAEATAPGYENIAAQNALAQVGSDTGALQKASESGGLLDSALAAQKTLDPEYYATRALTSQKLAELLNGMGPTVSKEIGQGLAQENAKSGTLNSPSQLNTVSNALQYGKAGQDALTTAIAAATSAMPSLRSGSDAFQVATGRSSTPVFSGSSGLNSAASLGSGLNSSITSTQQNDAQLALQKQLGTKDWADYLGQVTSSIGNLTSSAGSIAGIACWIARRVYGESDSRWLRFRSWLLDEAPATFRNFYLTNGQNIADKLTDSQCVLIKVLMNKIIGETENV